MGRGMPRSFIVGLRWRLSGLTDEGCGCGDFLQYPQTMSYGRSGLGTLLNVLGPRAREAGRDQKP
jgi:hypothetical protein